MEPSRIALQFDNNMPSRFVRIKILTKAKWLLATAAIVVVVAFYPSERTAAAEYDVTVCDETGHAIPGIPVHRLVLDYSSGQIRHRSEDRLTDANGKTTFPKLTHRISIMGAFFSCTNQILDSGAHASCGTYSDVAVLSGNWIEIARAETRASFDKRALRLSMSPCPSGNDEACRWALNKR